MNCKPGDLAVIIKVPDVRLDQALGQLVRLTDFSLGDEGVNWSYQEMPLQGTHSDGTWFWYRLPDKFLRPIRDPGEDVTDEMLLLLGKPGTIKEPEVVN